MQRGRGESERGAHLVLREGPDGIDSDTSPLCLTDSLTERKRKHVRAR